MIITYACNIDYLVFETDLHHGKFPALNTNAFECMSIKIGLFSIMSQLDHNLHMAKVASL